MKINKKIILALILVLAFLLRFWQLNNFPALNADEAAIGYNAYSLIATGKDEHGHAWPIHFQSFNDWKPGLYVYLVMPFVKLIGLNEYAVRIPNALLAVSTVFLIYLLVREAFVKYKDTSFPLLVALFLAISPWHIHFSRGGWEVNTATFFMTLGLLFFLKGLKNPKYFLLSILNFTFALYTYHAARIVVPLLVLCLTILYHSSLLKYKKHVGIALLAGFLICLPLAKDLTGESGLSRASGVGIFADKGPINRLNEERGEHQDFNTLKAKIFHNKLVSYSLVFFENYAKHFWGEFLFLSGDEIQRNRVPETGQMYLFDIVLLSLGLYALSKRKEGEWLPILSWLAIAPIPAALTFQSPHALRAESMVIPLVLLSAYGCFFLLNKLTERRSSIKKISITVIGIFIVWCFARYLHMYWVHMAKEYPFSSQYGAKEMVEYISQNESKFQKVFVTDRYDQPYILYLFYTKTDPAVFQKSHTLSPRDQFGFSTVRQYNKYNFGAIDFEKIKSQNPNSLIIGTKDEIPKEANIVHIVNGPNGEAVYLIVVN